MGDENNFWDYRINTACPNSLVYEVEAWAQDWTPTIGKIQLTLSVEGTSPNESTLTWEITYPTELSPAIVKGLEDKRAEVLKNLSAPKTISARL